MSLKISDPRRFSQIFPDSNLLINQAQHDLAHNDSSELMCGLIEDLLKQKQDQLLSVAYNLAPNYAISTYIWDNLQNTLNKPSEVKTEFFAIPVVFVVGSKTQIELNNHLDAQKVNQLLLDKQLITNSAHCVIADKLFDIESLAKTRPSDIYALLRKDFADSSLISAWNGLPILNTGEGIHLRFIVGYAKAGSVTYANYDKASMELMQLLGDAVKNDAATIYPIPFAPCKITEATVIGDHHLKDIKLTFTLSNQVKRLRLAGKSPELKLSAQKNNIQIEIWLPDAKQAEDILIWNLQPADSFEQVCEILESLFMDMHLPVAYYEEHHHD